MRIRPNHPQWRWLILVALVVANGAGAASVIPRPAHVSSVSGQFVFTPATRIVAPPTLRHEAAALQEALRPAWGFALKIQERDGLPPDISTPVILLRLDPAPDLGAEG